MTCSSPETKLNQEPPLTNDARANPEIDAEADAESDYGSDFTPDEEELLNALLVKAAGEPQGATSGEAADTAVGVLGREGGGERPEGFGVGDIEDYERVWRGKGGSSYGPKVFGKAVQQRIRAREVQQQQRGSAAAGMHPRSSHRRTREREGNAPTPTGENVTHVPDTRSPIERFRRPPMKALSVTDLISPAWCELQYWYSLTKHGRKRRTPAMKQGSAVHKTLEDQVHTTVPVQVTTKEDSWGLRIWNVIQGLRTLRETGMTRELEIWGVIDGEIVNGVIDQLSYDCPDPEMEASAEKHYSNAMEARQALPEYQTSITDYLLSPSRGGQKISDLAEPKNPEEPAAPDSRDNPPAGERKIYMTDMKTRGAASRSIPSVSSASFRPTQLQLHIYFHLLNRLATTDEITMEKIASRYKLDSNLPFTDTFIAEVGGLNEHFYDVCSSQGSGSSTPFSHEASQDSTTILLSHNNLSHLWSLMKTHLYLTFLPQNSTPEPPPNPQPQPFKAPTLLSPLLTATYLTPPTPPTPSEHLGSRSFLFDPTVLTSHLRDEMSWWLGKRQTRGVDVTEAWKCRLCEFRDECTWREEREEEMAESKRAKREALGG